MIMIGCAGPPTPEKLRMYHNLVAAPAFLIIKALAPPLSINNICHTTVCYLYSASFTLFASLDASLDFSCQLGRQLGL
jgi:hypothetical protein